MCLRTPSHLPVQTHRVGVFVNEKKQAVMTYADRFGLDYVQLHGNESPEYCRSLHSTGIKIIKAFAIAHVHDLQQTIHYEKFCEYFLFDTLSGQYGGSGRCFDWKILQAYNRDIPFILSGGIGPKSVQALSKFHHPCLAGYDINSHFELSPGEKDTERIQRFLDKLTIQFSL